MFAQRCKGAKVVGGGLSSRENASDLRKIFPFGRNDKKFFFACWRPSDSAQDMLSARKFLKLVLSKISSETIHS